LYISVHILMINRNLLHIWWCIQKYPDWPPGARIANGTALCHYVQLYHYFVSQSGEFCRHNPLCCFSTSVLLLLFISLSIQPGNFWIHPRMWTLRQGERVETGEQYSPRN
jgi:hypothetical protein